MAGVIQECSISFLSQERAASLVPPEYPAAWKWFAAHAGNHIGRLPMGEDRPEDLKRLGITLARQAGIHCPSYDNLTSGGDGKPRYALSVHSQGSTIYPDREKLDRGDGTWLLAYSAQTGTDSNQGYNETLQNCMRDGIPVGVFVASPKGGYDVLGLAFVEQFNTVSQMFTLHGPVTSATVSKGAFALFEQQSIAQEDQEALVQWDEEDERKRAVAERIVRERQDKFRSAVLSAYDGACAITGVRVPQVLQAAHIDQYRGRKSQIVNNGVLMRADLHLLYDANLIAIEPDTHRVIGSPSLERTPYGELVKGSVIIRMPREHDLMPDERLLELHYCQYELTRASA